MESLFDIIDSLDIQASDLAEQLAKSYPNAEKGMMDIIDEFIYSLDRSGVTIKANTANLKAINKLRTSLSNYVSDSEYSTAASKFVNDFSGLNVTMNAYFSEMAVTLTKEAQYKIITDVAIQSTYESLTGAEIEASVIEPVLSIIRDSIVSGGDRNALKKAISEYLVENTKLAKYADQIATDSVHQYTNNYLNTIAADIGLNHFYYKGTKIADSRPFCVKCAGKYFTESELKAIITSMNPWSGMIPGTTWANFSSNRGGYRCRHYLLPVTEAIYKKYKQ